MSAANAKRLALTRDQRAVLEAVYAIEKLPDATLRERLSKYLDLSTRQIQVWFQNRRQRAKASGSAPSSPSKKGMATPDQIMDALFEFTGSLAGEDPACVAAMSQAAMQGGVGGLTAALGVAAAGRGGGTSSDSGSSESPPATSLDYESFDWGLGAPVPAAQPQSHPQPPCAPEAGPPPPPGPTMSAKRPSAGGRGQRAQGQMKQPVAMRAANLNAPTTSAASTCVNSSWSPSDILDAILGFASHQLQLEAAELWPLPTAAGPASEPLYSHFALGEVGPDLMQCRRLLAPRLCESAAMTHEIAWYGVTTEQKEAFGTRDGRLPMPSALHASGGHRHRTPARAQGVPPCPTPTLGVPPVPEYPLDFHSLALPFPFSACPSSSCLRRLARAQLRTMCRSATLWEFPASSRQRGLLP